MLMKMKILTYGALVKENLNLQNKLEKAQVTTDWLFNLVKVQEKVIS